MVFIQKFNVHFTQNNKYFWLLKLLKWLFLLSFFF